MSEPSLADVILRLDRLEAALHQLIDVVKAGAQLAPAPVVSVAPAVQSAPPVVPVAPPLAAGVAGLGEPPLIQVIAPTRNIRVASSPAVEEAVYDPYAHRVDIVVPGPEATVMQVLTRVFEAGLAAEPEDTWAIMTKLTHPSQMVGPRALDHFKAFNWHKLRRTTTTYLQTAEPSSFAVAYTDPGEVTAADNHVRVFVHAGADRMPVPVGFSRDARNGGAWRVSMMSL